MNLQRLYEMIQGNRSGAEQWPVLFTSFIQNSAGEWREIDGARRPIVSVRVEEAEEAAESEVLLITDSDEPPLLLQKLTAELASLLPCCSEFTVDSCDTPIAMEDGAFLHIDVPVVGVGRNEKDRCYLILYASKASD